MKNIGSILNSKKWRPQKQGEFEGIRPSVKKTRLYLDNEYYKEGYGAAFPHSVTTVYGVLAMHANHKWQICYPAAQTIMQLCGIKNRTTLFEALKILEAYNIIQIVHRSKGRVPNVYGLTNPLYWKSLNHLNFETVMEGLRKKETVSNTDTQQSQKDEPNSSTTDTPTHPIESNKEVTPENTENEEKNATTNGKEKLQRLSAATKSVVIPYFREEDIIAALEALPNVPSFKELLRTLRERGATPTTPLPAWLNL